MVLQSCPRLLYLIVTEIFLFTLLKLHVKDGRRNSTKRLTKKHFTKYFVTYSVSIKTHYE